MFRVAGCVSAAGIVIGLGLIRRRKAAINKSPFNQLQPPLLADKLPACPFKLLQAWLSEAEASEGLQARAMVIATSSPLEGPTARTVLMMRHDASANTIMFGTNPDSLKGRQLKADGRVEAVFRWGARQVRVRGKAHFDDSPSRALTVDAYRSLPLGPQLSLRVASQGSPISEEQHATAVELVGELVAQGVGGPSYTGPPLLPPMSYSAALIEPLSFEFYQGAGIELGYINHDRFLYVRDAAAAASKGPAWSRRRLQA